MKEKLAKNILLTLAVSGAFVVAATSPYFLINIAKAYFGDKKYNKRKIIQEIARLKRNRCIILREEGDNFIIELTERGRRMVKKYNFHDLKIKKQKKWDGKWRIVIFDIPDKFKKRAREALRWKLRDLDFYQLQKSVWACPYPCENEVQFLTELFNITPYVNVIIAEKIFNDIKLRQKFLL